MLCTPLSLVVLAAASLSGQEFQDPKPPEVRKLEPIAAPSAEAIEATTFHAAPRPLAAGAVTEDWPTFLGPRRDGHTRETPLALDFGADGPKLVWEMERGEGYAGPALAGGRLVFTHRIGDEVHIDCLAPETGERFWRHTIPCEYSGRYIRNSGPRSSPSIVGDRVYVHAVHGPLMCLELATGRVVWQRDTTAEFEVGHDFFGVVSTPLLTGDLLVQNVGAPGGPSVAAFDRYTGRLVWGAGKEWGPSCASPVLATVSGKERLLVVAGGDSRPPTGGLMVLAPSSGAVTCEYPFRSRKYESVNGASPVACGDGVFLTSAYGVGSAVVSIDAEGAGEERWKDRHVGIEFSTPVYHDGLVYAVDGVSGRAGALVAIDPATGKELARESFRFEREVTEGGETKTRASSVGAGSLLHADGRFLVLGDTGNLAVVRARGDEVEVLADTRLFHAQETWTPPVVHRGLLYVCQNNPGRGGEPARLLCYDVRGGE